MRSSDARSPPNTAKRSTETTVEPVIGQVKHNRRVDQFRRKADRRCARSCGWWQRPTISSSSTTTGSPPAPPKGAGRTPTRKVTASLIPTAGACGGFSRQPQPNPEVSLPNPYARIPRSSTDFGVDEHSPRACTRLSPARQAGEAASSCRSGDTHAHPRPGSRCRFTCPAPRDRWATVPESSVDSEMRRH